MKKESLDDPGIFPDKLGWSWDYPLNDDQKKAITRGACYSHTVTSLLLTPIFLIPYFLRGIRLRQLFKQYK